MGKISELPPSYDEAVEDSLPQPLSLVLSSELELQKPPREHWHLRLRLHFRLQPLQSLQSLQLNYNNTLPFLYPPGHRCSKCKNTGFKMHCNKVCHDCWDPFYLRTNAYNPNKTLPFQYPMGFVCDICTNTGYDPRSGLTCESCWMTFATPRPGSDQYLSQTFLSPPITGIDPIQMLFGTNGIFSGANASIFTTVSTGSSQAMSPGDPRIGGIRCHACSGSGHVGSLNAGICPVCIGVGRVQRRRKKGRHSYL